MSNTRLYLIVLMLYHVSLRVEGYLISHSLYNTSNLTEMIENYNQLTPITELSVPIQLNSSLGNKSLPTDIVTATMHDVLAVILSALCTIGINMNSTIPMMPIDIEWDRSMLQNILKGYSYLFAILTYEYEYSHLPRLHPICDCNSSRCYLFFNQMGTLSNRSSTWIAAESNLWQLKNHSCDPRPNLTSGIYLLLLIVVLIVINLYQWVLIERKIKYNHTSSPDENLHHVYHSDDTTFWQLCFGYIIEYLIVPHWKIILPLKSIVYFVIIWYLDPIRSKYAYFILVPCGIVCILVPLLLLVPSYKCKDEKSNPRFQLFKRQVLYNQEDPSEKQSLLKRKKEWKENCALCCYHFIKTMVYEIWWLLQKLKLICFTANIERILYCYVND
ncbi:hypothetical protein TrispH2_012138, partial [Trichoplax sp. H2]